jgi:cobalt-zinc-cadmium resistance protein CzcA
LSIAVPVSLLLILFLLYFSFGSAKYGLLIFTAIPLSAIGGIIALTLRDMPFSISAGIGFIALFGVAVLNGIVMIAEFNRLRSQAFSSLQDLVLEGSRVRLRPVLMTASVASLGFLPMALSQGSGAEVQRPLATVVIGGLLTATFLTLFLLPVLYVWLETKTKSFKPNLPVASVMMGAFLVLPALHSYAQSEAATQSGVINTYGRANEVRISLDSVLRLAEENNLSLKAAKQQENYYATLKSGVFELPKTQLGAEYGKFNSLFNDNRLFLNQSFELPAVYRRQKSLYAQQEAVQAAATGIQRNELKRQIRLLYVQLVDLEHREQTLRTLDSIYKRFADAATLRVKAGETNRLEQVTAEATSGQLSLQLNQLLADRLIVQQQLMALTNTDKLFRPEEGAIRLDLPANASGESFPELRLQSEQINLSKAEADLEKSKLLPSFSVGYTNMSIVGFQTKNGVDNIYYGSGDRFHSVNLTLELPLFAKATRTRIKAAQVQAEQAGMQRDAIAQSTRFRYAAIEQELRKFREQIAYFDDKGHAQTEALQQQAREAYTAGELDFLQWTLLMNQAITIKLNYLDALKAYNAQLVELYYLNGQ